MITELPNISLAPGQYLLIQEHQGSGGTTSLPAPDVTDATPISMSATGGKVALVNTTTPLGCNGSPTPCDQTALATIVDLVGWGAANFFEGSAAAPATNNSTAVLRADNGCTDTDDNSADFTTGTPNPRNTASPLHVCPVSPTEAIEALIELVEGFGIHHGTANSLISKLENAIASLENSNVVSAIGMLNAFINEVEAQRSKKINDADADELVAEANLIVNAVRSSLSKSSDQQTLTSINITPQNYSLDQNFPNPFNPSTVIRYGMPENANVSLVIYDIVGRKVAELVNGEEGAGYHEVMFDGSKLSTGMYFYKLTAGSFIQINKMLLLK